MAAKDYVIVTGWQNAYLAKKKKPTKKGPQTMSMDCRPITVGECLYISKCYRLRFDYRLFLKDRDAYQKRLEDFAKAEHERKLKSKCALENYELNR